MSKLSEALRTAPLPQSGGARERAVRAVASAGTNRSVHLYETLSEPRRLLSGAPRWALIGVAVAAAVALLSLTPPGRAIAGDLGRLVGIGDQPTEPPRSPDGQAVVIGSGEAARSFPFEIVAETNTFPQPDETCMGAHFPTVKERVQAAYCLTADETPLEEYARHPTVLPAPSEFSPDAELTVQGMIPPGATVSIDYTKTDESTGAAGVYLADLTESLAQKIGVSDRARYFLATLPPGILRGSDEDPTLLTQDSVRESLARIHYRVVAANGDVIADMPMSKVEFAVEHSPLLGTPPAGFTSRYVPGN